MQFSFERKIVLFLILFEILFMSLPFVVHERELLHVMFLSSECETLLFVIETTQKVENIQKNVFKAENSS